MSQNSDQREVIYPNAKPRFRKEVNDFGCIRYVMLSGSEKTKHGPNCGCIHCRSFFRKTASVIPQTRQPIPKNPENSVNSPTETTSKCLETDSSSTSIAPDDANVVIKKEPLDQLVPVDDQLTVEFQDDIKQEKDRYVVIKLPDDNLKGLMNAVTAKNEVLSKSNIEFQKEIQDKTLRISRLREFAKRMQNERNKALNDLQTEKGKFEKSIEEHRITITPLFTKYDLVWHFPMSR